MNRHLRTFISILMVICMTILLHYLGALSTIEQTLQRIFMPVSSKIFSLGIGNDEVSEHFSSVKELELAYLDLKQKFVKETIDRTKIETLTEENDALKKQLNFFSSRKTHAITARVVGKNIDPVARTLILDVGADAGVSTNDPVIFDEGILLGKIIRTEKSISVVRLLNDNQSKIAATVLNQEKSIGIVEGGFGISVRLSFIPQNEQVNIGDSIITSGLEEKIPYGLFIGTIASVEKEVYEPFQRAAITLPYDLEKKRIVSVIVQE